MQNTANSKEIPHAFFIGEFNFLHNPRILLLGRSNSTECIDYLDEAHIQEYS